jgi:hypothetical protein
VATAEVESGLRLRLTRLQAVALLGAAVSTAALVLGAVAWLMRGVGPLDLGLGSVWTWLRPGYCFSGIVASIGAFALATVLGWNGRNRGASSAPARIQTDPWPAWAGAGVAVVGLVLDPVITWALERQWLAVAQSGGPGYDTVLVFTNAVSSVLGAIVPLLVLTPLVAAGIVWFFRYGRVQTRREDAPALAADQVGDGPA